MSVDIKYQKKRAPIESVYVKSSHSCNSGTIAKQDESRLSAAVMITPGTGASVTDRFTMSGEDAIEFFEAGIKFVKQLQRDEA